jgi:mannose-6-phosphate isomerase-like protein (cupin superfamily)
LWRSDTTGVRTEALSPGALHNIAAGTCFQFRNDGEDALEILITTIPPWPGEQEASACGGPWRARV